jgi:DNA polymerase-4
MIAHFDIDAFYASAAELKQPELHGKAVVIAHQGRRSVVLTASYEARKFGARSAIPLYQALELCPHAIVVEPDFAHYKNLSDRVFGILSQGGYAFETLSLDEAYLDLHNMGYEQALAYAQRLRDEVKAETQLTVSAGVASSKLVAKIASDHAKPDGLLGIVSGAEQAFLAPLPIGRLYGIGPKTEARLREGGLEVIGMLAEMSDADVFALFGRQGAAYRALARGVDPRPVTSHRERRSLSVETTFDLNRTGESELLATLQEQAHELADDLERMGLRGGTVAVKVKRHDFRVFAKQTQLREPTRDPRLIFAAARFCLRDRGLSDMSLRLLGIRIGGLTADTTRQLPLF